MKKTFCGIGFLLVLFSFLSCSVQVQKEIIDYSQGKNQEAEVELLSENNFLQEMDSVVSPFLNEKKNSGFVNIDEEKKLYYETFSVPQNVGTILIIHGFSENVRKYDELTYYFLKQNYNVVRYDHRGHGLSFREETNDLSKVYIKKFNTYVQDARLIYDKVLLPIKGDKPVFLFAHSMGGGVGTLLIETYPELFNAAILNAPMHEINTGKVPSIIARIIANVMCAFGKDRSYVSGNKKYEETESPDLGENSLLSKNREQYILNVKNKNILYQTNGATYAWLKTSFGATNTLLQKSQTQKVKIPVLLFQADNDEYVRPKGQEKFMNQTAQTRIVFFRERSMKSFIAGTKY